LAKLRQNHTRRGKQPFAGMMMKVLVVFALVAILFVLCYRYLGSDEGFTSSDSSSTYTGSVENIGDQEKQILLPEANRSEVIEHQHYLLGYNEKHEQADWVTYTLTKESLRIPNVPRADRFKEDPLIRSRSAKHSDYTRSGYSRGHLVPAGDMAFDTEAMQETFYMSNMSPQISGFNGGVWKELEESVRDWAYEYDEILVASGPIFTEVTKYIGKSSKIRVPDAFYKVIVDVTGRNQHGIAFVLPHEISDEPLHTYATSIDQVEELTGLDFFDNAYANESTEQKIESSFDVDLWPTSKKRYNNRVNHWNNN